MRGSSSFHWLIFLQVSLAALASGCGNPQQDVVPSYSPSGSASQAISLYDKNGDGSLEAGELAQCPSLQTALPRVDQDGNGKLSAGEISTRIASYKSQALAAIALECVILSNGQPLPNAVVTLVPEEFMKTSLQPAKGTANSTGRAFVRTEGNSTTGVQLGLYRVQVSLPNAAGEETLPAQFNTETALGVEVSTDVPGLERGVIFDLKR